MKTTFRAFVEQYQNKGSNEKKRRFLTRELAKIRNRMKLKDAPGRPRVLAKLMFMSLEGENCSFGRVEVANCMARPAFLNKWIGYCACYQLFDSDCDELLLVTQTIISDIQSSDPRVQCLALAAVANIGGDDLTSNALAGIQKVLDAGEVRTVKYATMAALTCVKTNHDLYETFRKYVPKLLNSSEHAVILAGINLAIGMMNVVPVL